MIWSVVFLSGFRNNDDLKPIQLSGNAQGTTFHIIYYAEDSLVTKGQINRLLNEVDSSLSLYKPYSLISEFNRSADGLVVDQHFLKIFNKSREIYQETKGSFDITVKPLVSAWGFGVKSTKSSPDTATIRNLLACVGTDKLHLTGNYLRKEKACVEIDLNGIAQGYTVDLIAAFIESKGIGNYLVELGGEIRVKGRKRPSGELMSIGIESPAENEFDLTSVKKTIQIETGAVTTSGNYRKFKQLGNKRISHLIDPTSGYPFETDLISVTVYAKDAISADGYDNALMGMGLEKALLFVEKKKDLEAYFIYRKADDTIADTATAGFYKLIKED